ncbi:hypothetical protein FALCPG4_018174 [Fusarium falciforme]
MRLTRSRRSHADTELSNSGGEMRAASPAAASDVSSADTIAIPTPQSGSISGDASPAQDSEQSSINRSSLRRRKPAKQSDSQVAAQTPVATKPIRKPCSKATSKRAPRTIARIKDLAGVEIARVEDAQERADRHAKWREHANALAASTQKLDQAQYPHIAAARLWSKTTADSTKSHGGIKYERKFKGPFTGKLVSQGILIDIDGEEHVEYRVLAKLP